MLSFLKNQQILTKFINQNESKKFIYQLSKLNQDNQQTLESNTDHHNNHHQNHHNNQNHLNENELNQLNKDQLDQNQLDKDQNQTINDQSTNDEQSNQINLTASILKLSSLKPRKSYETKTYGNHEMDILKVNRRKFLIYDENNELIRELIDCIKKGLNLSFEDAKDVFFQLSFLRDFHFTRLFSSHKLLELELRKISQILNTEQIKIDLNSIKLHESYLKTRFSILKLIGLNANFSGLSSFTMIMCQTETNLKLLNLIDRDLNLLEHVLSQLDLNDNLKSKIRLECSDRFTVYELLSKISVCYFASTFDLKLNISKLPLIYLDLSNILNVISLINQKFIEFDKEIDRKNRKKQIKSLYKSRSLLRIDYDGLKLVDNYLKENDLNFIWKHLLHSETRDSSICMLSKMEEFLIRIEFLIQHRVPADLINNHFYIFFTKQNQLKFFFNNFGDSFLEYFDIPFALSKHHQIIQLLSQLTEEDKKDLSFTQFMDKHFKS